MSVSDNAHAFYYRISIIFFIAENGRMESLMKSYKEMSKEELASLADELEREYKDVKERGLKLDMSRGKPSKEQLDISMPVLDAVTSGSDLTSESGVDCRNYGCPDGIDEARRLMADIMEVDPDNVIVCGNASLPLMYDSISRSYTHGVCGEKPWYMLDKVKWLCPVPGYDRHFAITEHFGIEMITVPMLQTGPDMDVVESYVNLDPAVKGIWCVPKYSNPQGISYSDDTVRRIAALTPAAADFRVYWDNAYAIHHLYDDDRDDILEIFSECEKRGNTDMVLEFASTSKVSFAGAGIAGVAASKANLKWIKSSMAIQIIGHDKINMLRHARYFKDINGLDAHMRKHAEILRPKYEAVLKTFDDALDGLGIAKWTKPKGGYFISFDAMEGCAKEIVDKCKEAGVTLTAAGATYPYGRDPEDSNIRIAPSLPSPEDMAKASELFVLCVKLVSARKILSER